MTTAFRVASLVAWIFTGVPVFGQAPLPTPVTLTLHVPETLTVTLALDELELRWVDLPHSDDIVASIGVAVRARTRTGAALSVAARDVQSLASSRAALMAANPGADIGYVVYEGPQRTASSRRVLTSRVALLLVDATDPGGVLVEYAARDPRPIDGIAGAYELNAGDPLSAADLADALRARLGVTAAYPMLTRAMTPR